MPGADDYHIVAQLDLGVADAVNAAGERLGQRRVIQIHIVGELIHRLGADGHILGKAARSHNAGMRMRHEGRHAQVFVTAAAVVALAAGVQQPDSRFVAGLYAFHVRADGLYDPGRLVASGIRIPAMTPFQIRCSSVHMAQLVTFSSTSPPAGSLFCRIRVSISRTPE